ncbi:MAG: Uma2 family endonuclease [Cyanobacteria bacterium J06635_15]
MPFTTGHAVPQTVPPRSPRETLPTMYDLPSESIGESGLPDEYHDLQPQLLSRTLALADYTRDEWFAGSDLNLYYDVHHPLWYKRPDWFLSVGVPRLYDGHDMRRSYVTWQEGRSPDVVIEFLSPGTEQEDLGRFYTADPATGVPNVNGNQEVGHGELPNAQSSEGPPPKFTVYEAYLRVPHYLVYNRKTHHLRYFQLVGRRYEEQPVAADSPSLWLTDLQVGLGIWDGYFDQVRSRWLRWCNHDGLWLPTDTEREQQAKEQERQAKEQERQAKEQAQAQIMQAAKNLLATGMTVEQVVEILGLSAEQRQQL